MQPKVPCRRFQAAVVFNGRETELCNAGRQVIALLILARLQPRGVWRLAKVERVDVVLAAVEDASRGGDDGAAADGGGGGGGGGVVEVGWEGGWW